MTLWNPPNIGFMLIVVHSIVTRGIAVLADRSQAFAQAGFPDASTQNGFTDYARAFVSGLRGHHQSEDEVVFPFLRENMPDVPYDELVSNHQKMEAILQEVEAAIAQWEAGGQPAGALGGLNGAVKWLAEIWQPHIQKEEQHFSIPTLAALIAPEEHARARCYRRVQPAAHRAGLTGGPFHAVQPVRRRAGRDVGGDGAGSDRATGARGLERQMGADEAVLAALRVPTVPEGARVYV